MEMLRKSVTVKNFNRKVKELNLRIERLEKKKVQKQITKGSNKDPRFDKLIPSIMFALTRLLSAKGMQVQRKRLEEEVRKAMDGKDTKKS